MCQQDALVHLSMEEEAMAEESFSIYCKPVELYNILQRRAAKNPSFLERCLKYKIQAKHKKRIQMAISLPSAINDELKLRSVFPLCIILARQFTSLAVAEDSAVYRFGRVCMLTTCTGANRAQAKFILPEISKLSEEVKSGSLAILFISCAELATDEMDMTLFPSNGGGYCFLGKIPMELLHLSWEKSPNLISGERTEMLSTVEMHSCFMKSSSLEQERCVSFQIPHISGAVATSQRLQVFITAEEVGGKERSPYDSYSYNDVPISSLPQIMQLRTGNVVFNYKYYNNRLQKTEVTEDFACAICLIKCASYKGLRNHLTSCHDLFNFEFWVTEEYQAVNVSVKTDTWRSEIVADGVDPKNQTFCFCSQPLRRRKPKSSVPNVRHVHPLVLDSPINELAGKTEVCLPAMELSKFLSKYVLVLQSVERDASSPNITGVSSATAQSFADPECVQSLPGSNLTPPALLQFAKTRKLSVERSDSRNRALLRKRQFFHSHRAQPMELEQVLSDEDSEDEVDDDVADLEDRRMLDDFVDVTKDEKQMMHLWNSFVRKQRVLADGHIPWACEAFAKLHAQDFVRAPSLLWCWRLFMIKLWNHGLLDAGSMNNCNLIFEQYQNQDTDPVKSYY